MKRVLLIVFMSLLAVPAMAQDKKPKTQTIQFKTSALCGMCKNRIEEKLNYSKGVVYSELNLDTKVVTVKYKTKELGTEDVYKLVTTLGYKAGEMERDTAAFKKLPKCCREEGFCED